MRWTLVRTGEETCSLGYTANLLRQDNAWVQLRYTTMRRYGEEVAYDYPIHLVTTPQPFGGVRWWFVCPLSGRRVRVLYLPPVGGTKFACREALGLPYRSQRFSPEDRADERSLKARKKLGVKDQNVIEMPFLAKPKWMRQHTYARLVAIVEDRYEHQVDYAMRRWGVRL